MFLIFTVILLVTFIVALVRLTLVNDIRFKDKKNKINIEEKIDIREIVKDRTLVEEENKIVIGNNEKEIQNQYFDIKIEVFSDNIKVFFNKLLKKNVVKDGIYVDEEYLYQVLNLIYNKYMLSLEDIKIKELVIIISDEFENFRKNLATINKKDLNIDDKYNFNIYTDENMLKLDITLK